MAPFWILCFLTCVGCVTIRTPQGLVDGKIEGVGGFGSITKFLGIPYAKPPIKTLRFKPPVPVGNFTDVYDATYGRTLCPQPESYLQLLNLTHDPDVQFKTSEDCLYLNVYIPGTVRLGSNFPVMVWIHGGSWVFGSGTHYDARKLAAQGRVIVVTVNYRLGLLGFVPDGSTAGTLGLQDMILALKWVRWNIWSFGGDPGMVTIFGESAGGASVSFLTSSLAARNLFNRAISQSGLKSSAWALDESRREEKLQALALRVRQAGCYWTLMDCLRKATAQELVAYTQFAMSTLRLGGWTPHVDGYVIAHDILENTTLINPDVERIIGFNSDEGGTMLEYMCTIASGEACRLYDGIEYNIVKKWTAYDMDLVSFERIGKQYNMWYPGPKSRDNMSLRAAASLVTDWFERFATNRTASVFRELGRKIWVYQFNAKPRDELNLYIPVPWSDDAQHCDDVPFIFHFVEDAGDQEIAKIMIEYWTSFAKGKPSPVWLPFGPLNSYLYIARTDDQPLIQNRHPLISPEKEEFWHPWFYQGEFPPDPDSQVAGDSAGHTRLPGFPTITTLLTLSTFWTIRS